MLSWIVYTWASSEYLPMAGGPELPSSATAAALVTSYIFGHEQMMLVVSVDVTHGALAGS